MTRAIPQVMERSDLEYGMAQRDSLPAYGYHNTPPPYASVPHHPLSARVSSHHLGELAPREVSLEHLLLRDSFLSPQSTQCARAGRAGTDGTIRLWDFSSVLVRRGNPTRVCLGDSVLDFPTPLYCSPVGESTLVLGRDWAMLQYSPVCVHHP